MTYVLCWNTCGGLANGLVSTSFPPRLHAWWWRAIRVEARHIARLQPDIQQKAVVSSHGQGASDEEKRGRGRTRPGPEARVQNGGQGRTQVKGHKPRARAGEERIRGASGGRSGSRRRGWRRWLGQRGAHRPELRTRARRGSRQSACGIGQNLARGGRPRSRCAAVRGSACAGPGLRARKQAVPAPRARVAQSPHPLRPGRRSRVRGVGIKDVSLWSSNDERHARR